MIDLMDKFVKFLSEKPGQKFTALEIAKWILETYPDECQKKKARSRVRMNDESLIQQIADEIYSQCDSFQEKNPRIKTTEDRPRKYYYT